MARSTDPPLPTKPTDPAITGADYCTFPADKQLCGDQIIRTTDDAKLDQDEDQIVKRACSVVGLGIVFDPSRVQTCPIAERGVPPRPSCGTRAVAVPSV